MAPRRPWSTLSSALPAALSVTLMDVVSLGGMEKVAVPMVSVFAFSPFLVALLTVSVSLPLHLAVPAQASLTIASPLL